jgi:AcrR family transcriptional regulator
MPPAAGTSTKSDQRRAALVAVAVETFAHRGFYGTTTHEIADAAMISQPYLYRLYPNKEALFVAAVDHVSGVLTAALSTGAPATGDEQGVRDAYAALIENRTILRFLMHANCAAGEPLIAEAVRRCYAKQVATVRQLLGGDDDAVRRWFGAGMVDNVVTVLGLADLDEPWARVLSTR